MKKKLLILTMCLFSALSANAASWVAIDSGSDNIQLFIDSDSIKYSSVDTCTYALLYKKGDDAPKFIYAKSNYLTDRAGIVIAEDYNPEEYKPRFYSKHSTAFMKNIADVPLLRSAHNFALAAYGKNAATNFSTDLHLTNINAINDYTVDNSQLGLSDEEYSAYVENIKSVILSNWKTSVYTANSEINLIISINSDGSYNGYRLMKSKGDERAKRSAIAAVNLSAPFAEFPDNAGYVGAVNIPVTFKQKLFKKYVK